MNQKTYTLFNWSTEDFTQKLDGVEYTFKSGESQEIKLGDESFNRGAFAHFVKHLTDREMTRDNIPTNSPKRVEYEAKAHGVFSVEEEPELLSDDEVISEGEEIEDAVEVGDDEDVEVEVDDEFSEMSYRELQAEAAARDLPKTGKAEDLRSAIREYEENK